MRTRIALLLALLLTAAACGGDESAEEPTTLAPTTTTTTTIEVLPASTSTTAAPADLLGEFVTGADKLASATDRDGPVTYQPAGVDETQVGTADYRRDVTLDVYYPPGYDFDEPLPAVVLVNAWSATQGTVLLAPDGEPMGESLGTADFRNAESYISMANVVAASGLIAVVYGTGDDPAADLHDAMTWLRANADELGIDPVRTALWMWSAHTLVGMRAAMADGSWQDPLRAAVVYYGWMPVDDMRTDLEVQLIRASLDQVFFLVSQDDFLAMADDAGAPVDTIVVAGPHSFDHEPGYEEITAETIESSLDFLETAFAG